MTAAMSYEDAIRRQDEAELRQKRCERIAEIVPAVLKRLENKRAAEGDPDHDDAS